MSIPQQGGAVFIDFLTDWVAEHVNFKQNHAVFVEDQPPGSGGAVGMGRGAPTGSNGAPPGVYHVSTFDCNYCNFEDNIADVRSRIACLACAWVCD